MGRGPHRHEGAWRTPPRHSAGQGVRQPAEGSDHQAQFDACLRRRAAEDPHARGRGAEEVKLASSSFADGGAIPAEFAFCAPDAKAHATLSKNRNPQLAWSDVPMGTKSFAIVCHDPDVPSKGDDVNQEGRTIPASLPRIDFFHWVLVDLPASTPSIAEGAFASSVTARGKPGPHAPQGARQGINDYTGWFASDKDMSGQ